MDINQAARMIEWLDEERRRDKATIATLEERLAQQQELIDSLQRRLNGVEADQTTIRDGVISGGREQLMEAVRQEMRQLVEAAEAKRLAAEREAQRRAELQQETMNRTIKELQDKLTRAERLSGEISDLKAERDRLAGIAANLQQRLDDLMKRQEEPDRRLAFLEEQRRQDARRLSEVETEIPDIKKQIEGIRTKLGLLEELALRNERRIQEIQMGEGERRDQIQAFIDQQTLLMQQRDQQIKDLLEKFGEQDSQMQRNLERFEQWADVYRQMKRIVEDFDRIGDRLERRINEVAEMQRLSEERFRDEWNDWRAEDQKRWKQFTLSNDDVWRNHDKEFERFVQKLGELEAALRPVADSVERMWRLERERARLYRERYQALLLEYDTAGTGNEPSGELNNGTTTT
ncbi:MAG: hypothetical protein D6712_01655 [Chloroflexi bacterium]|nr:MAG: hypothetical protein D6712_01655 [Chloroflexota bacterium]